MTTPHLFKHPNSGIYYFRIAIPKALRKRLKQREWKKSLKTREPREAQRTARRVTVQVEYLFSELNKHAIRPTGYYMPRNQDDMAGFDLFIARLMKHPDGSLEAEGLELDPDKVDEEMKLLDSVLGTRPEPRTVTPITPLADVIEDYCKEKVLDKSWRAKTEHENRAIYALLLEIIGNCSMTEVDHSTARAYKQTLLKLPANINKATGYKDKSLKDILAMDTVTPMATSTVNKHLTRAASLFEWAVKHGYVETNYFAGLTLKKTNRVSEERATFTRDDITRIFSQKPFTQLRYIHSCL